MKKYKNIIVNIFWIILGVAIIAAGEIDKVDSRYAGLGGGLIGVGIISLIRCFRYRTNPEYKEKVDVACGDERNNYIRTKAMSWAAYFYIIGAGIICIICMILSFHSLMLFTSYSLSVMALLYWVSYMVLSRKY